VPVPITVTGLGEKLAAPEDNPAMFKVNITDPGNPPSSTVTVNAAADPWDAACDVGVTVTVTLPGGA